MNTSQVATPMHHQLNATATPGSRHVSCGVTLIRGTLAATESCQNLFPSRSVMSEEGSRTCSHHGRWRCDLSASSVTNTVALSRPATAVGTGSHTVKTVNSDASAHELSHTAESVKLSKSRVSRHEKSLHLKPPLSSSNGNRIQISPDGTIHSTLERMGVQYVQSNHSSTRQRFYRLQLSSQEADQAYKASRTFGGIVQTLKAEVLFNMCICR